LNRRRANRLRGKGFAARTASNSWGAGRSVSYGQECAIGRLRLPVPASRGAFRENSTPRRANARAGGGNAGLHFLPRASFPARCMSRRTGSAFQSMNGKRPNTFAPGAGIRNTGRLVPRGAKISIRTIRCMFAKIRGRRGLRGREEEREPGQRPAIAGPLSVTSSRRA